MTLNEIPAARSMRCFSLSGEHVTLVTFDDEKAAWDYFVLKHAPESKLDGIIFCPQKDRNGWVVQINKEMNRG